MLMKKVCALLLLAASVTGISFAAPAVQEPLTPQVAVCPPAAEAPFVLNGKNWNGKTSDGKVPLRGIAEALGYKVSWDSKTGNIALALKDGEVQTVTRESLQGAELKTGTWYVAPDFFRDRLGAVMVFKSNGACVIDTERFLPDEASTVGEIMDLVQGKDGVQILVKGSRFGKGGYEEISLAVTRTVPVTGNNGGALKKGDSVYVVYGPAVTKSLPPMGQATAVEVLNDRAVGAGKVYDVVKSSQGKGYVIRMVGTMDVQLTTTEKTVIVDATGKTVGIEALKDGTAIRVYTSQIMAMSYPGQTEAYRIEILEDK